MHDERRAAKKDSCGSVEGGFTISLDEDRIRVFMEAGDFSSAGELEHFAGIGAQIDARVRGGGGGVSLLALSIGGKGLERDFAVLEIAHLLAKNGKSVLVVDCDFLHPGLGGLVENLEEHGFLDLLLYGSSLKSVARTIGIDGVTIAGPGSFPVSRTIPFALKEFDKIRDFLRSKHDVVIYCTTLHTEDGRLNPLVPLVDGVIVACRIENLAEGELERHVAALGAERAKSVELVCFCGRREEAPVAAAARPAPEAAREVPRIELKREAAGDEALPVPAGEPAGDVVREAGEPGGGRRFSRLRILLAAGAVIVAAFVVWWLAMNRTVKDEVSPAGLPSAAVERPGADTGAAPVDSGAAEEGALAGGGLDTAAAAADGADRQPSPAERGTEEKPAPAAETARTGPAKYTIHVASFTDPVRAEAEKELLEKSGFSVRVVEVPIRGERWLRVFAGSYATTEEADGARLEILALKGHAYARIVEIDKAGR